MEELLNELIQKGWKPRGNDEWKKIVKDGDWYNLYRYVKHIALPSRDLRLRNFVSKESGLWQFCCENKLIKSNGYCNGWAYHDSYDEYDEGDGMNNEEDLQRYYDTDYQYYIIECALKEESDLGKFLLENIKIEDRKKEFEELVDRNIDVAKRLADK